MLKILFQDKNDTQRGKRAATQLPEGSDVHHPHSNFKLFQPSSRWRMTTATYTLGRNEMELKNNNKYKK